MEITTTQETEMTRDQLIAKAQQLETDADNLHIALLAPSMQEQAWREEAKELREKAAK